jgi:hypothetical protein
LAQSAFDPNDALSPVGKTYQLALLARGAYRAGLAALDRGATFDRLNLVPVRRALSAIRWGAPAQLDGLVAEAERAVQMLAGAGVAA